MRVFTTLLFSLALVAASSIRDDPNAGQKPKERFDRSSVENEGLRNPFYSTLFHTHLVQQPRNAYVYKQPTNFLTKTRFGTYWGAAANPLFIQLLPRVNSEVFPLSKHEIQSKPVGISQFDARKALQEATFKDSGMYYRVSKIQGCFFNSRFLYFFKVFFFQNLNVQFDLEIGDNHIN